MLFIGLLLLPAALGCGKSDAQRMAEYREKYAGAGAKDSDDEDESNAAPSPVVRRSARSGSLPPVPPRANAVADSPTAATPVAHTSSPRPTNSSPDDTAAPKLAAGQVTDRLPQPATPMGLEERRGMTIANLQRISEALEAYRETTGGASYPSQYRADSQGAPLLSWRVHLLPFLGYEALYQQFKLNEPWDSEHNQTLLEKIPAVYQSPERLDIYTNIVVPASTGTAFYGHKAKGIRRWEDGLENTIIVVEADDDRSVLWTRPVDLDFNPLKPREGLGNLRADGFFAIWGGGKVHFVPNGGGNVRLAFTVDDGESVAAGLRKPATASPDGLAAQFQRRSTTPASGSTSPDSAAGSGMAALQNGSNSSLVRATGDAVDSGVAQLDAQSMFDRGRETEAMQLYLAEIVASPAASHWVSHFRWIPALSRPAPIVRYGVGIQVSSSQAGSMRQRVMNVLVDGKGQANQVLDQLVGRFGRSIINRLPSETPHCPFVVAPLTPQQPSRDRRRSRQPVPPKQDVAKLGPCLQLIGVDRERVLLAAARKHEVDVLVMFDIEDRPGARGRATRTVQVKLFDVVRRKELYAGQPMNNRRVSAAKQNLLADDPTQLELDAFQDYVDKLLESTDLPRRLNARAATKRVAYLADHVEASPLRMLTEIQLYRTLGLVDLAQQQSALAKILDAESALTLLAGTREERLAMLEPHLPRPEADLQAEVQRDYQRN